MMNNKFNVMIDSSKTINGIGFHYAKFAGEDKWYEKRALLY